jgi:hypothetical protein
VTIEDMGVEALIRIAKATPHTTINRRRLTERDIRLAKLVLTKRANEAFDAYLAGTERRVDDDNAFRAGFVVGWLKHAGVTPP